MTTNKPRHEFDETRYCRNCGLPAEFVYHWRSIWAECFLSKPSPERMAIIRSGAWRSLPEFRATQSVSEDDTHD